MTISKITRIKKTKSTFMVINFVCFYYDIYYFFIL